MCAELLLSGILAVNGKTPEISKNNDIIYQFNGVTYAIPDKYNIDMYPCKDEQILKRKGITMRDFLLKVD